MALALSCLPAVIAQETKPARMINFASEAAVAERKTCPPEKLLTSDQRAVMLERVEFCRQVYQIIKTGKTQNEAVNLVATRACDFQNLVKGGHKGASALTLTNYRAWVRKLGKKHGRIDFQNSAALADRYGRNIRGAAGPAEYWKAFNGFYLTEQKLSISEAYRLACELCRKYGIGPVPTERQTRFWMGKYADQAAVLAARYGETFAENHIMSYIRRDWSSVTPGEIWIGDHHVFDVFVKEWDEENKVWRAVRPWLTAWLDAVSLMMVGTYIRTADPDHVAILTALQKGIRDAGNQAPDALYTDNGKDFLKMGVGEPFTVPDTTFQHSVVAELGIKTIRSIPYRARAKTVERIFKEVCERFAKRWTAYLGNRPQARPEAANFFSDNPEYLPAIGEFTDEFMKFLDTEYHAKDQQDGKILAGKSPIEVWNARPERRTISDKDLWFAMLVPYTKNCPKVGRGAAVVVDSKEYRSDALWPFFGKKVFVKLDSVNNSQPQAFTLDGKWICALEEINTIPAYAKTAEDKKLLSDEMKRQRRELRAPFETADEMSGGLRKLSAQEQLSINPAETSEIIPISSRRSVKGSTHNFVLYKEKRELTKGEERKAELEAFDQAQKPEEEKEVTQQEIADFHKFIINTRRQEDDN